MDKNASTTINPIAGSFISKSRKSEISFEKFLQMQQMQNQLQQMNLSFGFQNVSPNLQTSGESNNSKLSGATLSNATKARKSSMTIPNVHNMMQMTSMMKKESKSRNRFTDEEDELLRSLVETENKKGDRVDWCYISSQMKSRTNRQCRERYMNYLSNKKLIKNSHRKWTPLEDDLLMKKYEELGPRWTVMTKYFEDRTNINIKNRYSCLTRLNSKQTTGSSKTHSNDSNYSDSTSDEYHSEEEAKSDSYSASYSDIDQENIFDDFLYGPESTSTNQSAAPPQSTPKKLPQQTIQQYQQATQNSVKNNEPTHTEQEIAHPIEGTDPFDLFDDRSWFNDSDSFYNNITYHF
ncbi:hypothetical protein TRFO_09148 [Tritrichomonas foetus]|uniref:Myb-like DNA-binding domain containing protein n=1 Tax=Tritrichomonas foetus TaxID=1144522 RepID=A0A1J4JKB9_9EUKA|nr:hypothetical protein TRFO_09148 [Tritrichomonas foetus]|eukprot:OHS97987.1 hypothetical protein TRFO_09148 [Tritrichomonas foetus]